MLVFPNKTPAPLTAVSRVSVTSEHLVPDRSMGGGAELYCTNRTAALDARPVTALALPGVPIAPLIEAIEESSGRGLLMTASLRGSASACACVARGEGNNSVKST